jgi:hypothetical protein
MSTSKQQKKMTKEDVLEQLKEAGVTDYCKVPLQKLSLPELEALLEAKTEKKSREPMSGLSSMTRQEINWIYDNLQSVQKDVAATKFRNSGQVLLATRALLMNLEDVTVTIGKRHRDRPYKELLLDTRPMEEYRVWMLDTVHDGSHVMLKSMATFVALRAGQIKKIMPQKEEKPAPKDKRTAETFPTEPESSGNEAQQKGKAKAKGRASASAPSAQSPEASHIHIPIHTDSEEESATSWMDMADKKTRKQPPAEKYQPMMR